MSVSVSIITLTKNRSLLLQQCLRSLVGQLSGNDELVLLDNGSTDNTPEVAHAFQQFFTVRYFVSRALGYPKLYNMAVSKSTQKIIVFLDDDCIAGRNFVSHIKRAHKNRVNAYVIQGKTVSIPRGNIYVDIMGDHYANWVSANMMGAKRLRTFDNKNASMPRSVWLRGGGFSEQLSGGSEDIDLGFRLRKEGIQIIYNSSIVAYHHERNTFSGFMNQHRRIAKSEAILSSRVSKSDAINEVYGKKVILHIQSAARRELQYLRSFQIKNFVLLPCLYIVLAVVRIWTYHMTTWMHQK